jgi:hypothetical protein
LGRKDPRAANERPIECGGKDGVEIEQRHRRDEEVCLVNAAEMHCSRSCPAQQQNSGQHHADQQHDGRSG